MTFEFKPGLAGCSYIRWFEDMYGGLYDVAPMSQIGHDGKFIIIGVPDLDRIHLRSALMEGLEEEGVPPRGVIPLSIEEAEYLRDCLDACIRRAKAKEPDMAKALSGDPGEMAKLGEWLS